MPELNGTIHRKLGKRRIPHKARMVRATAMGDLFQNSFNYGDLYYNYLVKCVDFVSVLILYFEVPEIVVTST